MKVRDWHTLERHPLSAEYADLTGPAYADFVESMRRVGYLADKPVVLHEGRILDGWQRLRAAWNAGVTPTFVALAEEVSPEDYVSAANDHRRHMHQETARITAEKRRERVLRRRAEGASTRAIASEEHVSPTQVRRDLEASGGTGGAPEAKVTGRDGKEYDAAKPQTVGDANEDDLLLCGRCLRVGPSKGCDKCAAIREKHANKARRRAKGPTQGAVHFDTRLFAQGIGLVVRQIDALAKHYGAKESRWHQDLLAETKSLKTAFDDRLATLKKVDRP